MTTSEQTTTGSAGVSGRGPRFGGIGIALVVGVGTLAVAALAAPSPQAPGAARLRSPEILLAVLDTLWLWVVAGPWCRDVAARLTAAVVGLPFHLVLAGAAAAGPAHVAALALVGAAFAAAAQWGRPRAPGAYDLAFLLAAFVLPVAGYVALDLLGTDGTPLILASPLTAPTLLARQARTAELSLALPAVLTATLLVGVCVLPWPRREEASS